jgi:hypothetical protein
MSTNRLKARIWHLATAIVVSLVGVVTVLPPRSALAGPFTGLYEIKNANSGLCLSVHSGVVVGIENMEQFTCGSWSYQKFRFEKINSLGPWGGWFAIHPLSNADRCLGIENASLQPGAQLQQQYCDRDASGNPRTHQLFALIFTASLPGGNTQNKIRNQSGLCMRVVGASHVNHAIVTQDVCDPAGNTNHIKWDFKWLAPY